MPRDGHGVEHEQALLGLWDKQPGLAQELGTGAEECRQGRALR